MAKSYLIFTTVNTKAFFCATLNVTFQPFIALRREIPERRISFNRKGWGSSASDGQLHFLLLLLLFYFHHRISVLLETN